MISTLRLEAIGDNYRRLRQLPFHAVLQSAQFAPRAHASQILNYRAPWVARIVRVERDTLVRDFVHGSRDYRNANGTGSRGVYLTYVLHEPHVYEVHEMRSWSKSRRYFCRAERGEIFEVSLDEARSLLSVDASTDALQRLIDSVGA
jgi:hypothetical protein